MWQQANHMKDKRSNVPKEIKKSQTQKRMKLCSYDRYRTKCEFPAHTQAKNMLCLGKRPSGYCIWSKRSQQQLFGRLLAAPNGRLDPKAASYSVENKLRRFVPFHWYIQIENRITTALFEMVEKPAFNVLINICDDLHFKSIKRFLEILHLLLKTRKRFLTPRYHDVLSKHLVRLHCHSIF